MPMAYSTFRAHLSSENSDQALKFAEFGALIPVRSKKLEIQQFCGLLKVEKAVGKNRLDNCV
jgi:hypothetical protein